MDSGAIHMGVPTGARKGDPEMDRQMDDDAGGTLNPRRRRIIFIGLGLVLLIGICIAVWVATGSTSPSSHKGPEGVAIIDEPDLAPATTTLHGQPVGQIQCVKESNEVVNYHTHTYVSFFVNGSPRRLPAGVGITKPWLVEHFPTGLFYDVGPYNCLYWIHTHTADNIVHIEAPAKGNFTLGELFTIWNQPLSSEQVGPAKGPVVVFANGRRLAGNPRSVPLHDHETIQIDVGSPVVAFEPKTFKVSGLCGQGTKSCAAPK